MGNKRKYEVENAESPSKGLKRLKEESPEIIEDESFAQARHENEEEMEIRARKKAKKEAKRMSKSLNETHDVSPSTNGSHGRLNGNIRLDSLPNDPSGDDDGDEFELFLIRKPTNVTFEHLRGLKFSGNETVLKKRKLKTESGNYLTTATVEGKQTRMLHIPTKKEITHRDSQSIKAAGFVSGFINILPAPPKEIVTNITEEGQELEPFDFEIKPIKKSAVLELDCLKERNLAYGVKSGSKKRRKRLPDLLLTIG